ncbi:MAG: glycoside hydrolase family 3 C-terminal domain-containing protein, partial [Clostridia bacterium]|nr:glycoside hydrolase family 3 C-terminal domain-containing protein [Clostridia bacterium]
MKKWTRMRFQPCIPLGEDGRLVSSCDKHTQFSRKTASEGMVLLKNEGILPFEKGTKIAVFGKAQIDWINAVQNVIPTKYQISLLDALTDAKKKGEIEVFEDITDYYREEYEKQKTEMEEYNRIAIETRMSVNDISEPHFPIELADKAAEFADVAIVVICRRGGENNDRKVETFELTENERLMIEGVCARFEKVVALLNIGSQIETDWIKENDKMGAALLVGYPGMEGGAAVCDVLLGKVNPSGKLVDTYAKKYADYPSSAYFNISDTQAKYYEDIYVGYRYFETIPEAKKSVNYPFGFGLSYTEFEFSNISANADDEKIYIKATVTNVGEISGKEVVQVYYSAPQGKLGKPERELGAFKKTRLLATNESQIVELEIKISDMASYDDFGKCAKSAYILEKGNYSFHIGNSVRNTQKADFEYEVKEDFKVVEQLSEQSPSIALEKRMKSDGTFEELPTGTLKCPPYPQRLSFIQPKLSENRIMLIDVAEGRAEMDDFIAQLDREYMIKLTGGKPSRGVSITNGMGGESRDMSRNAGLDEYGVP